jgi:hypothetical protein
MMQWWNDATIMLLLICPIAALVLGMGFGVISRMRWIGASVGITVTAIPIVVFEAERIIGYMALYSLAGLIGSSLALAVMSFGVQAVRRVRVRD